jgi:hypothetical protein
MSLDMLDQVSVTGVAYNISQVGQKTKMTFEAGNDASLQGSLSSIDLLLHAWIAKLQ